MPATILTQEIATLRHLALGGDKLAHAIVVVFDALRAEGKEFTIVKAATTANRALSGLTNTVLDGQTPVDGDVVLVKSNTDAKENGLYVTHAGAWTRLTNYNNEPVLAPGMHVFVRLGSTLAGTLWACSSTSVVVGTDNITFTQFTGGAIAPGAVTVTELAAAAVTAPKLAVAVAAAVPGTATITLAAASGGHIDATVQLKDINGVNLAVKASFIAWVSDVAAGVATSHTPTTTAQSGVLLASITANKVLQVVSDATGAAVIRVADTGQTYKLNVAIGNSIVTSADIVLA